LNIYDCSNNGLIDIVSLSSGLESIAYCPSNNCIYTGNIHGEIDVVDCSTNATITTINSEVVRILSLVYCHANNCMYGFGCSIYTTYYYDEAAVIDCSTQLVTEIIRLATIDWASFGIRKHASYNPVTNSMIFSNILADTISMIDCSINTVVDTIDSCSAPEAVSYCAVLDKTLIGGDDSTIFNSGVL